MCEFMREDSSSQLNNDKTYSNAVLQSEDSHGDRLFSPYYDEKILLEREWTLSSTDKDLIVSLLTSVQTESRTPAGYTYLGQFITHEIVRDSNSEREKGSYRGQATPVLNLDSVYFDQEFLYHSPLAEKVLSKDGRFIIGAVRGNADKDLPRVKNNALIPEPRNDENIIISQFHVLWLLLHNKAIGILEEKGETLTPAQRYIAAKAFCTLIFQRIVVEDYLQKVLHPEIFRLFFEEKNSYIYRDKEKDKGFQKFKIPLEFSHAAFRFGHAMVRPDYTLSDQNNVPLSRVLRRSDAKSLTEGEIIEWKHFFPLDSSHTPQMAMKIELMLPKDMLVEKSVFKPMQSKIETKVVEEKTTEKFSQENLEFLREMHVHIAEKDIESSQLVPSGGALFEMMKNSDKDGVRELIRNLLIPDLENYLDITKFEDKYSDITVDGFGSKLSPDRSPLWLFLLREAEIFPFTESTFVIERSDGSSMPTSVAQPNVNSSQAGPLCSLIIAEVLSQSIKRADTNIYQDWECQKSKLSGPLEDLYVKWAIEERNLTMGFLINEINLGE